MLFCDFHSKIKKLNKRLWIDTDREVAAYHPNFAIAGIYLDDTYVGSSPHQHVPEYTWEIEEKKSILAPGWKQVVTNLIQKNLTTRERVQKVFGWVPEERQQASDLPKVSIAYENII